MGAAMCLPVPGLRTLGSLAKGPIPAFYNRVSDGSGESVGSSESQRPASPLMLLPLSASPLLTSSQESVFQEQCEGLMEEESEGEEGQDRPQEEGLQAASDQASPLFAATAAGEKKTERQRKKEKADKQSVSWASPRSTLGRNSALRNLAFQKG